MNSVFNVYNLHHKELDILLKWYNGGKSVKGNLAEKKSKLLDILDDPAIIPPVYEPWSEEEENELVGLKETEVTIENTKLAKAKAKLCQELAAAATILTQEEKV